MAEARPEEEEENTMRDTREQVVRRQPNSSGGRPDRRKPEHRHSQGPLSSIRAAIKRTSTRTTSLSEPSRDRDRDRERERDRDRDRRRPEITILSAEPLASTSWFPGGSGGFPPPPPPPAAQIWGPTIPPSIQPPPSYEEVIKEKTQELLPPPAPSSSSRPASTITIATQTDPGSAPDPQDSQVRRPARPPRPPVPYPPNPSLVEDVTTSQSASTSPDCVIPNARTTAHTPCCELLSELCSPLTSASADQSDQWDQSSAPVDATAPPATSSHVPLERPRPRPRTRLSVQPISSEVKVQTLVKLREDGLATLAARAQTDNANQEARQGKYLQELLEAFSADDWGFPERRSDSSGHSQSESDEGDEDEEDMATLRARIQAFEQQQQVAEGSGGDASNRDFVATKRPEPRPRPRLQGQPAKSVPPTVAPKPKNFSHAPKPSSKVFWEDGGLTADSGSTEASKTAETPQTAAEPSFTPKPAPALVPQPCKNTEKPLITPKPQLAAETVQSGASAPVPAPRPPPPKLTPSGSETPTLSNPKPPPRPPVAPRASIGAPQQDKSPAAGHSTPTLPPRPSVEVSGGAQTGSDETQDAANQTVKAGSGRPGVPTKPAALTSPRRASAPHLAPKPSGASVPPPDPNAAPPKPAATAAASRPSGPAPGLKPPAPALRKGPVTQTKPEAADAEEPNSSDPPLPPRPSSSKLLPLRPPPIKSTPGRPPPPAVTSASSANQMTPPPPAKTGPAPSVPTASQPSLSHTTSSVSANQMQSQRAAKRGPPLPPRPKPGHPLYSSYVKQEVLIVLDDPSPSEHLSGDGRSQTAVTPLIHPSQCLLDLDIQPEPVPDQDSQSKPALEDLGLPDSQSILPVQPSEQKEEPEPPPVSGPRCVASFDYEGEEDDELTFSQGDVIVLLELVGQEWGRGQIHGRIGVFPLNFTEVVEPLPPSSAGETANPASAGTPKTSQDADSEEWAVALFDFPGQTAEDLSFHKGALIQVTEHVDAEWRRGRLEGREGLYPAAFAQTCQVQQSAVKGRANFDFTAESENELTLKVGDIITQVESVDEQWILGVVDGKRGIVPKNYISIL